MGIRLFGHMFVIRPAGFPRFLARGVPSQEDPNFGGEGFGVPVVMPDGMTAILAFVELLCI